MWMVSGGFFNILVVFFALLDIQTDGHTPH